ncbi:hypothetical protein PG2011B_1673 [Bifidobacterium animalis subsp. lactis]|uniref:Uncharacterized protein n=1 Tax=Bifidobacterium animalis subsp. lactis TaxID=302911 RepID=A0A8B3RFW9_BIFAN|nr:hypothetical protein PG2011B_1673 [Bifidobacterium animalis subsp. lactis]
MAKLTLFSLKNNHRRLDTVSPFGTRHVIISLMADEQQSQTGTFI